MRSWVLLACLGALVLQSCSAAPAAVPADTVKIASFNLQVFGTSKAGKPEVMSILGQIIRRFDVVAVQEIRDSSGTAVVALKDAVNATGASYEYEIGPRLGSTSSKEQYAFFYNTATVEALPGAYTAVAGAGVAFEREPYVAKFKAKGGRFGFTLVDVHTRPEGATAEISCLPAVISEAAAVTGEPDVLCLGDFNADGSYYDEDVYLSVFPASTYNWLIPNTLDTTIASSSHTYDRVVTLHASDEDFTGNAGVFRFDEELTLGGLAPGAVSDHYPVWVEFWTQKDSK
jgi:deoxyribonuclease-1-like protein